MKINSKNQIQKDFFTAVYNYEIIFAVGPAGTGKTYIACAAAIKAYEDHRAERIILVRPIVEAGEKLGFLPGTFEEKIDPYLLPVKDSFYQLLGAERTCNLLQKGIIEIAPLAYMRGRTISNAVCILDEAQNATQEQMKMFLTRLGEGSKLIITGDLTQSDLPKHIGSGLNHAITLLEGIDEIQVIRFSDKEIVRHPLIQKIVGAYEKDM